MNTISVPKSSTSNLSDGAEICVVVVAAAAGLAASHAVGANTMAGNAAAFVGVMLTLATVLFIHRRRGDSWTELGLGRPRSWWKTTGLALLAFPLVMMIALLIQGLVIAPLVQGQAPDTTRFDSLRGNLPLLLMSLVGIWISAAFAEEVIYRGFMLSRLARLLGGGRLAWWTGLLISSTLFSLLHLYQGIAGVAITGTAGFLLGALYLIVRRNLWVAILVHGFVDTLSLTALYLRAAG